MSARFDSRPALPEARGGLSAAVIEAIGADGELHAPPVLVGAPLDDDDLHLALYVCYELHYRSFAGVADRWEWDPALIAFRTELESAFMEGLESAVPLRDEVPGDGLADLLFELAENDSGPSLSTFLQNEGTLEQFREFVIHRSAYQLKEADPHTWAIPRMHGAPKAAMVEIQADEYGSGRPDRVHAVLFAKAMDELGLDSAYGAYLDRIPGVTLATVNLISRFALHREWRGALTGHLAMFEITSPVPNRRYAGALRRFGASDDAIDFFDEHVEADSVHEQVAARDLAQGLALAEPDLAAQIVFGAEALLMLEGRWGEALLARFADGESSLRPPVGAALSRA